MSKQQRFHQLYFDFAQRVALMSRARRLKVGAVIVKDDVVIYGYNGTPAGWDNNCEDEVKWPNGEIKSLTTKPEVLHAESNAISKMAKTTLAGNGASMYCTHSPCMECAKLIYQAGIQEIYYGEEYRSDAGLVFLDRCGILVEKITMCSNDA